MAIGKVAAEVMGDSALESFHYYSTMLGAKDLCATKTSMMTTAQIW
jgi:hypothetical protein